MPGDGSHLTHVRGGDPLRIKAPTMNAMLDAARAERARRHAEESNLIREAAQTGICYVKNSSGGNLDRFNILGIDDFIIAPADNANEFKRRPMFVGDTPADADHVDNIVILLEPIANGKIGRAAAAGVVHCQINMTDATHKYAVITDGDATKLTSNADQGFRILRAASGTGTKWAIVRLDFHTVADPWTATTLIKTSTGTPGYIDANADLGLEYLAGASNAETRAFFRFPAAVNGLNGIGRVILADGAWNNPPWQLRADEGDTDSASGTFLCTFEIKAAYVTASIADTITWGAEPASEGEVTIGKLDVACAYAGGGADLTIQVYDAGAGGFQNTFMANMSGPDKDIYGLRIRVVITENFVNPSDYFLYHDQSESSESLALWYAVPEA